MRRREKVDLQRTISPEAARCYAPRQGSKPRKCSGRQSQSRRAGTEVLGQQEVASQTAAPGQDRGTAKAAGSRHWLVWREDGCLLGKLSKGATMQLLNQGENLRQNTIMVHYVALQRTTLIQSNNTVNYRINHLEKPGCPEAVCLLRKFPDKARASQVA